MVTQTQKPQYGAMIASAIVGGVIAYGVASSSQPEPQANVGSMSDYLNCLGAAPESDNFAALEQYNIRKNSCTRSVEAPLYTSMSGYVSKAGYMVITDRQTPDLRITRVKGNVQTLAEPGGEVTGTYAFDVASSAGSATQMGAPLSGDVPTNLHSLPWCSDKPTGACKAWNTTQSLGVLKR